jgi:hypothetical protein
MVVALSVAPSELQHAIEVAERVANENNLLVACSGRCAIAALNLAFIPMPQGAPVVTQYAQALTRLTATDVDAMRAVKRALDGNDVLNRGRFVL